MGHWFTFEFRHQSWLVPPVCKLLERAGAALWRAGEPDRSAGYLSDCPLDL